MLFALTDLTVNCPQVVSRVFLYNEMLINLDCDFKKERLFVLKQGK
jgi:hypothetical protein